MHLMKKTYRYLMLALAGTAILSGCGKKDDDKHADETEALKRMGAVL